MAKTSGGVRIVGTYTKTEAENRAEYFAKLQTQMYVNEHSSISAKSGAYVLFMKGHNYNAEEIEAAKALSNAGINVILTPEGAQYKVYATNKAKLKFSEGYANIYSFEQRTPKDIKTKESSIKQALRHTNDKHSQICVIYDKYNQFHRNDIDSGMNAYQEKTKDWEKIKAVLVVDSKLNVYEHYFEK